MTERLRDSPDEFAVLVAQAAPSRSQSCASDTRALVDVTVPERRESAAFPPARRSPRRGEVRRQRCRQRPLTVGGGHAAQQVLVAIARAHDPYRTRLPATPLSSER